MLLVFLLRFRRSVRQAIKYFKTHHLYLKGLKPFNSTFFLGLFPYLPPAGVIFLIVTIFID
jgi:hypothetical protein